MLRLTKPRESRSADLPAVQNERGDLGDEVIEAVVDWTDSIVPIKAKRSIRVPGASPQELERLTALGALVGAIPGMIEHQRLPLPVRAWLKSRIRPPANLVGQVACAISSRGPEFLASIYEAVVAAPNRRTLGTFFTPASTVEWMLERWDNLEAAPEYVIDVGAGVGAFSLSATSRWHDAQIAAVDVNPVTLGLLAVAGKLRETDSQITYVLADFIRWVSSRRNDPPTLILGNPPYTRIELLPLEERERLAQAFPDCGARAGLSTWMLASALQRLRQQDGLLMLLPTNWLDAQYADALRTKLWMADRRRVELTYMDVRIFGDVLVETVTLHVGPVKNEPQPFVARARQELKGRCWTRRNQPTPDFKGMLGIRARPRTPNISTVTHVPLGRIATIRRGVATGANNFFTLSQQDVDYWRIPERMLQRVVRRIRDFRNGTVRAKDFQNLPETTAGWLLRIEDNHQLGKRIKSYIAYGKKEGIHRRQLCALRSTWYILGPEACIPDVIIGSMTKDRFRFIVNQARATITNNNYGLTWLPTTGPTLRRAVLQWLRSEEGQAALRKEARAHAVGLHKLEPRALSQLKIPIPKSQIGEVPE